MSVEYVSVNVDVQEDSCLSGTAEVSRTELSFKSICRASVFSETSVSAVYFPNQLMLSHDLVLSLLPRCSETIDGWSMSGSGLSCRSRRIECSGPSGG